MSADVEAAQSGEPGSPVGVAENSLICTTAVQKAGVEKARALNTQLTAQQCADSLGIRWIRVSTTKFRHPPISLICFARF